MATTGAHPKKWFRKTGNHHKLYWQITKQARLGMDSDTLYLRPRMLLTFIDETGVEDLSDPKNPTFGRGGCAVLAADYKKHVRKPWRKLKRERLGGALKPFHATEFQQSRPTKIQIIAISRFLQRPFWRFAAMIDEGTELPPGVDAHKAISLVTVNFIRHQIATYPDVEIVGLVFEASERSDKLVRRDFGLANMNLVNGSGRPVEVEGYFMPKTSMEPGLEVADLVAHTAGRQRRHQIAHKEGVTKDFEQMYWHSPIPPAFISIDTVQLSELAVEDDSGKRAASPELQPGRKPARMA
jgi:hypothetical protein